MTDLASSASKQPGGISAAELQQRPAVLADDLTAKQEKRFADPGRLAVFVVGALLLALFVVGVVIAQTDGSKTNKSTPHGVTTSNSETTTTAGSGTTPSTSKTTTTTSTDGGVSDETTKSAPSEGLLLALLGMGVLLVLVGALYSRITTIKLPGGGELVLSPEESQQVTDRVVQKAKEESTAPSASAIAKATSVALQLAHTRKLVASQPLDDRAIEQVAAAGLEAAGVVPSSKENPMSTEDVTRMLNVVLAPGSAAHRATKPPAPSPGPAGELAPGLVPQREWNLTEGAGRTISDLVFVNRYVGEAGAWSQADMASIDGALNAAMSDAGLQSVIAQYYQGQITSRMLPSAQHQAPLPGTVYKDTAEQLARELHAEGVLGGTDPASCVINIMLPEGTLLSDDFSPGFQPPAGSEAAHRRRKAGTIKLNDKDAAISTEGLGGYHGSIDLGGGVTIYYAVGVYSNEGNGIVAFDKPWKNVVATFYHELNESRTDPDVEQVNASGNGALLGWYSQRGGGEIGDLPITLCQGNLQLVFKEVPLANGNGTVPIQLMWSNRANGPAAA